MFERPHGGERAILVHVDLHSPIDEAALQEFHSLSVSAGVEPLAVITTTRRTPDPKYFIGSGKVEEIKQAVEQSKADVVLFNNALSPAQERNLERDLKCRVLDRTGLILDIFAQRAHSHDGKLQVELAQLRHLSTRLVRGWTHLERQKGGIGLRGPGETQLETDRRLLAERIKQLNRKLSKVQAQREQGRRKRKRAELPTVSIVGYTNAGKSTLFNSLTQAAVYAADQLFATLDPTLRRIEVANGQPVILADTVGFIRDLPHQLVAAFRSTLQETRDADLLLHVVDASSETRDENIAEVNAVLEEIGASEIPQLLVYNKIDALADVVPHIDRNEQGQVIRVWISARAQQGLEMLQQVISELLYQNTVTYQLDVPPAEGRFHAKLYEMGVVDHEEIDQQGHWQMQVSMPILTWQQLCKQISIDSYCVPHEMAHLAAAGQST